VPNGSIGMHIGGNTSIYLNTGDYIDVRVLNNFGSNQNNSANPVRTYITIKGP
jgi:hypothetical protein